jgi:Fe-S-cluster containining protein
MALYDPPDGTTDPRPRCVGHCCRGFSLELPFATVQADYARWKAGEPTSIPDVGVIGAMLVPLGVFRGQELFTCRHLGAGGDCTIYDTRPGMCRDFPGPAPCPYRNCASHGEQPAWKKALNWLRD